MEAIIIQPERCELLSAVPAAAPPTGFLWLDVQRDEVAAAPDAFRDKVAELAGTRILDLHLVDTVNVQHPSFFDGTQDYDMLIFRKLTHASAPPLAPDPERPAGPGKRERLQAIVTRPIAFFVFEHVLVTVRTGASKTIEQMRMRLLDAKPRAASSMPADSNSLAAALDKQRPPARPEELMLRLLNGMVDRYLELREPLTERLDNWQRELLDPRRPFSDWGALLDARIELRKLENLCEGQYDALQELRDSYLETAGTRGNDALLVRVSDVMEHVRRVLQHTRRLEASAESAVQLHFSSTAHRTNQVVRTLTVITAVFAPLTVITGIWGMNFERIPLAHHPEGFWILVGAMGALAVTLLMYFSVKRFIGDRPRRSRFWPF